LISLDIVALTTTAGNHLHGNPFPLAQHTLECRYAATADRATASGRLQRRQRGAPTRDLVFQTAGGSAQATAHNGITVTNGRIVHRSTHASGGEEDLLFARRKPVAFYSALDQPGQITPIAAAVHPQKAPIAVQQQRPAQDGAKGI
jgi:hypothetical protein